jgi:hypothetical protein
MSAKAGIAELLDHLPDAIDRASEMFPTYPG